MGPWVGTDGMKQRFLAIFYIFGTSRPYIGAPGGTEALLANSVCFLFGPLALYRGPRAVWMVQNGGGTL